MKNLQQESFCKKKKLQQTRLKKEVKNEMEWCVGPMRSELLPLSGVYGRAAGANGLPVATCHQTRVGLIQHRHQLR